MLLSAIPDVNSVLQLDLEHLLREHCLDQHLLLVVAGHQLWMPIASGFAAAFSDICKTALKLSPSTITEPEQSQQ